MGKKDYSGVIKSLEQISESYGSSIDKKTAFLAKMLSNRMSENSADRKRKKISDEKIRVQEAQQAPLLEMMKQQQAGTNLSVPGQYADPTGQMPQNPYSGFQGSQASSYPGRHAPSGPMGGVADPFSVDGSQQPKARYGKKGQVELYNPSVKEQIFDRIQEKETRNFQLTKREKAWKDDYLGVDKQTGVWKKSGLSDYKRNQLLGEILVAQNTPFVDENGNEYMLTMEDSIKDLQEAGYLNYEDDPDVMEALAGLNQPEDFSNLEFEPQPQVDYSSQGIVDKGKSFIQDRLGKASSQADVMNRGITEPVDKGFEQYVGQARKQHQGSKQQIEKHFESKGKKVEAKDLKAINIIQQLLGQGKSLDEISALIKAKGVDPQIYMELFR